MINVNVVGWEQREQYLRLLRITGADDGSSCWYLRVHFVPLYINNFSLIIYVCRQELLSTIYGVVPAISLRLACFSTLCRVSENLFIFFLYVSFFIILKPVWIFLS